MRFAIGVRLGLVLGVVGFVACKDEGFGDVPAEEAPATYADVVCGQASSCGCFEDVAGAEESCKSALDGQLQEIIDVGNAAGLTYDGSCVGRFLDLAGSLGCRTSWTEDDFAENECWLCKIFHGDKGVGEPCGQSSGYDVGDDCAQGLSCWGERCVDPCATVGEGGDCSAGSCDDGLYCDWDYDIETEEMTATCVRAAGEGEACGEQRCDDALECDIETMTCVSAPPLPGVGEACTGSCREEAYCDTTDPDASSWTCVARKSDGEACESDQECLTWRCEEGTCTPDGPIICSLGGIEM